MHEQVNYSRALSGVAPAAFTREKPTASKDALITMLRQSFEYCAPVVADIRDATLEETIKVGRDETATALVLLELVSGMDHHPARPPPTCG